MRVLVTGGAGYIGSVTVEALLERGHHVEALDDLSTGHRGAIPASVTLHETTYTDAGVVEGILRRGSVDAVLHLGARSLVGESVADPARYYRQNVAGGVALLDGMRAADVRRIVFSSSAAVYGAPERTPIDEDAALLPINPYGETKRTFETALMFYASAYGLRSMSLRYFNAAGASVTNGEDHLPETHLIPSILRAAAAGAPVAIFGADYPTPDGTCVRDFIHVEDLAQAHVLALEATSPDDPRTGGPDAGSTVALNLGTGRGFSVRDVVDAARRVVGQPIAVQVEPRRPGDPPVLVAAPDRATATLDWRAGRPALDDLVESAWAWRRDHPSGYGS